MRNTDRGFAFHRLSGVLFAASLCGAPTAGLPVAAPSSFAPLQPTAVTVSCLMTSSDQGAPVLTGAVNLLEVSATDQPIRILAKMRDDGQQGDSAAADGIFSVRVTLSSPAPGTFRVRCSGALRGVIERFLSPVLAIPVVNAGPILTPSISVTPSQGAPGRTIAGLVITGQNTSFTQADSKVSFGAGITVNSVTVTNATTIGVQVVIAAEAVPGSRTVTVTTGNQVVSLPNGFTVTAPTVTISFTSPANLSYLNLTPTTVSGSVSGGVANVVINGITTPVASGQFSAQVPLAEGPNILTATAAAATASITVTLDTTPPRVTITNPPDKFITDEANITIAGSVNDIVVGTVNDQQAQVTVNGTAAQVANRTFLATAVPLNLGDNVIQAVGRDRSGNSATTQITVNRQPPYGDRIRVISGSPQSGTIGSVLPAFLVVALTDAAGNPVPNKPVIFKVTQNDGMVTATGVPAATVIVNTDSKGQAQAQWTLGNRAGAGGNMAEAYSVGFSGTAIFTATGNQGPAGKIVIDSGNGQIGAIGQPLPRPLIAVVVDPGNNRLGGVSVTFKVLQGGGSFGGSLTFTTTSDSDGRVAASLTLGFQEGNANNLVEATFAGNQGFPAAFTASGRSAGDPLKTVISGVVLDNSNSPIPGVTIYAELTNLLTSNSSIIHSAATTTTDAQGQFTIPNAPVGFVKLLVNGSTARVVGSYPTLDYDMVTVAGQANNVGSPIFLLPLNPANQLCVTPTTGGGTLTIPEAPGFSLTFGPGQVTFPGNTKTGCVSVTAVHPDKVPMTPGFGQQPRFIVTIQPAGAVFNPPAPITLPNVDGLKPREVTEMYSFDHDIGSFVAIGTGVVSDDGQVIRSTQGVGVLKAGWHCGGNPVLFGSCQSCALGLSVVYSSANTPTSTGMPRREALQVRQISSPSALISAGSSSRVSFALQNLAPESRLNLSVLNAYSAVVTGVGIGIVTASDQSSGRCESAAAVGLGATPECEALARQVAQLYRQKRQLEQNLRDLNERLLSLQRCLNWQNELDALRRQTPTPEVLARIAVLLFQISLNQCPPPALLDLERRFILEQIAQIQQDLMNVETAYQRALDRWKAECKDQN